MTLDKQLAQLQIDNKPLKPKEPPICYCTGTTETRIKELINNKVNTLERIANATGATTGCGACEYDILELIKQSTTNEDTVRENH